MVLDSLAIKLAKPPVAITLAGQSISRHILCTSSSTWPTKPYKIPACMLSTVFLPITERGLASSTRGSLAACLNNASVEMPIRSDCTTQITAVL